MSDEIARDLKHQPDENLPSSFEAEQQALPNRTHHANAERTPQLQVRLAEAFVRENIYNPINITDIATATGISIRALQRLFRQQHGATPHQFLASLRIAAARALILDGQAKSVRHLAAKLHFTNPGRFSKLYRTAYSHTPSQDIRSRQDGIAS